MKVNLIDKWCMQRPRPAIHTQPPHDGKMGWRALMLDEWNERNDKIAQSNGQREQEKDGREEGREWTGLSLISSVLTYIMHTDISALQHLLIDSGVPVCGRHIDICVCRHVYLCAKSFIRMKCETQPTREALGAGFPTFLWLQRDPRGCSLLILHYECESPAAEHAITKIHRLHINNNSS